MGSVGGIAARCALAAVAGLLAVQPAPAAAAPQPPPVSEVVVTGEKTVSELVVTAEKTVSELIVTAPIKCLEPDRAGGSVARTPQVVSTFPQPGSTVRPGLVVLRVTFDLPMGCYGGFTDDPPLPNPCPWTVQRMHLSLDRRTVRTVCVVAPNGRYAVWMNRQATGADAFISLAGTRLRPYRVEFATSAGERVTTVCDALTEDAATLREIEKFRRLDCSKARPPAGD
jgi:hypothetical protein